MLTASKQALKAATRQLVQAAGGQEAAATYTRFVRHQAFSDFGNAGPDHAAKFAPIDAVADLEAVTHGTPGHPVVTRALARAAGFALVPLPAARTAELDFAAHLQAIIRETADVTLGLSVHLQAAASGKPAPEALRAEVAQAIQVLVELDAALAQGAAD